MAVALKFHHLFGFQGAVHFFLVFTTCTYLGNYSRMGIQKLSEYKHSFIAPSSALWPNFTASMIMGLLQVLNAPANGWFNDNPQLFTALTTGYCGCFSSYSTMILEIFQYSTSLNKTNISQHVHLPNRAYGIMEFLSVLFSHLFISMGAYLFGRQFAQEILVKLVPTGHSAIDTSITDDSEINKESVQHLYDDQSNLRKFMKFLDTLLAALCVPLIIITVVLAAVYDNYSRASWTLVPIFGIFGAFLRYYLSNLANSWNVNFPWGTFIANQFAVVILNVCDIVQRGKNPSGHHPIINTKNACRIISAFSTGFCGSLSTISTFINEGYKLKLISTLLYYFASVSISYIICVIMLGAFAWSRGLIEPIC